MLNRAEQFLKRQSPGRVLVLATAILLCVAYLDWIAGQDVRVGIFCLVPIVLATAFAGTRAGLVMAVLTSGTWLALDLMGRKKYHNLSFAYVNAMVRLLFFTLSVYVIAQWRAIGQRLQKLVEERTAALSEEVAERKAAEESLHKLSLQMADVEDAERRRLAHDIHDTVGQNLSVVKFRLESAAANSLDGAKAAFVESAGLIDGLIQQTRTLTFELHPPMLDDLGLVPALRWYAKVFAQQTQTQVTVEEHGEAVKLPVSVGSHLFRSAKELMNNARKHGLATELVVSVHWRPNDVRIVVDDNGKGFVPEAALSRPIRGLGLAGIQERTSTLGGTLELESEPAKGSRAILRLPLTL